MIKPSILSKYLAGDATDEETQLCEEFLQEPGSIEELMGQRDSTPAGDSLLETLRNLGNRTTQHDRENVEPKSLVEQIQSLVASQPVGQEEFDRILSPAESSDEIGRIAHYRVIEFIASGGMGLVFKAEDSRLNRLVCIKVLNPLLATNRDAVARFEREVQSAAKLRNTRITTVLEFGEHKQLPYLVMELLEGQSLRDKLAVEGKLSPAVARKLTIQIAEGLRYAHQRGYLHRDIKPENIWVTPEGDIKLLDFGLARTLETTTNLTQSGMILGTPTYMSPEQIQGKELDEKSDLFSVGTVLFEMVAGESPFGKSNLFSTMMSVANDSLAFPDSTGNEIPDDLKTVIQSLLQKSPEDRLESSDQLIAALNSEDGTVLMPKTEAKKSRMSPVFTSLIGGVVGAACLAFSFLLYQINDKGTLVVEADPSIKVSIANEEVSIEDPQTGKSYKVVIGKTPLRSGVYQLQMTDASGQYTLSSEVITIRRGEQKIVRVELKPNPNSIVEDSTEGPVLATPAKPAPTLAELPTLDANELKRKLNIQPGEALFRNAIVAKPPARDGVTSWSIEPAFESAYKIRINSNGSRIATQTRSADNKITIWNRDSQPTHIIPAQDKVVQFVWSPDPDIIAIVEIGKRRKQVTVCKLFEDHLEVIDVIPCEGNRIAWSWDGLRLAVQSEEEITFIDLAKGAVFAHANFGIRGKISNYPWSKTGRYFAATVDEDVKVWDLEEKKLLHIFSGKKDGRFLPKNNEIAVNDSGQWEVWDLDSFVRVRTLKPETEKQKLHPDPSFQRVAFAQEGKLVLKELETGSTAVCDWKLDPIYTKDQKELQARVEYMDFEWAQNGNDFVCDLGATAIFLSNAQRRKGASLAEIAKLQPLMPLGRKSVGIGYTRLKSFDLAADARRFTYCRAHFDSKLGDYSELGTFSTFDIAEVKQLPLPDFRVIESGAKYALSPDGELLAFVGSSIPAVNGLLSQESLAEFRKIQIYSVASGKLVKTLETGLIEEMIWSPDSTSLVVSRTKTLTHQIVKRLLERYDIDKDGKLSIEEAKPSRGTTLVDKNKDGFVDRKEIAESFVNVRNRRVPLTFNELETRIYNVSSGDYILLQANATSGESTAKDELCFQRGHSRFARPVIYENQIVLPLFVASTFPNGNRMFSTRQNRVDFNDMLGFFDIKTGKLTEVTELNCEFKGQFEVTKDLIATRASSRENTSRADSFIVFDRQNKNEGYLPMSPSFQQQSTPLVDRLEAAAQTRYNRMMSGTPHLSPKHPLVAVSDSKQLEIWRLDSDNQSFGVIKTIRASNETNRDVVKSLTWHPTKPIVAWIVDGIVHSYNADSGEVDSYDAAWAVQGIAGTADGWFILSYNGVDVLDHNLVVRKTYRSTERFENYESVGTFDQCISADGTISNKALGGNLRVIQLRENRIETSGIEVLTGDGQ